MNRGLSTLIGSIRFVPQHGRPRQSLHQLPLVQEALDRWPQIRRTVANALVAGRVETDYDQAFAITDWWYEVQFPEGEAGRAIMIGFDGGQELGEIMVHFSNWQLTSIEVDHTGDWFCPLSDTSQQINLLLPQ